MGILGSSAAGVMLIRVQGSCVMKSCAGGIGLVPAALSELLLLKVLRPVVSRVQVVLAMLVLVLLSAASVLVAMLRL